MDIHFVSLDSLAQANEKTCLVSLVHISGSTNNVYELSHNLTN